ncbi:DUF2721 domain-containing protein [Ramlibacter sp. PS4R-6]|uniref:DUF2721 domain-containing protein n=1 Tax=Ramlibacter sp. PS4R-6 TaxID=3133438 RepID=UPI0030A11677
MAFTIDTNAAAHGIQLAVAPVFLLTAVSGMIGAVAGRLARIIDRARRLEDSALASSDNDFRARANVELDELRVRGRYCNACIALLTTCAFLIGVTIILLFVGETTSIDASKIAVGTFLFGVAMFLAALLCFLRETLLATRVLDVHVRVK